MTSNILRRYGAHDNPASPLSRCVFRQRWAATRRACTCLRMKAGRVVACSNRAAGSRQRRDALLPTRSRGFRPIYNARRVLHYGRERGGAAQPGF